MAEDFEVDGSPPEESENRTFVVAAAGLGGLIVLSLICLGLYVLVLAPRQRQAGVWAPTPHGAVANADTHWRITQGQPMVGPVAFRCQAVKLNLARVRNRSGTPLPLSAL